MWLTSSVLGLLTTVGTIASAQGTALPRDRAIAYLQYPEHGLNSMPGLFRRRVLSDPSTLSFYAELLEGRAHIDTAWSREVAVWWLAESGDPRFMDIFLRYAQAGADDKVEQLGGEAFLFELAAYGLARTAAANIASTRIRQLLHETGAKRIITAWVLTQVNDTITRSLLRELPRGALPPRRQEMVDRALAAKALPHGDGRAFCEADIWGPVDPKSQYRCRD